MEQHSRNDCAKKVIPESITIEAMLNCSEKFNPKFCFLNPFDAYHKYYAHRVQECQAGSTSSIAPRTTQTSDRESKPVSAAPKVEKPRDFKFSADMPPISAQDLDILRLTAQFVAKNGRSFITILSQREARNFQFDFLRSNHSLYPYFNVLVQQYSQILAPPPSLNAFLSESRQQIFDRCKKRAEYTKTQALLKIKAKEDDEKERLAYASIDWHSFAVVETIEFTAADETANLAPPVDLNILKTASLEQKALMQTLEVPSLALSNVPLQITAGAHNPDSTTTTSRKSYLPRAQGMQKCPRCGELFKSDEIDEHMRIELLDPKWKLQKEKADSKRSSTNLYTETAAQNLKRLNTGQTSDPKRPKPDIGPR